MVNNEKEKAMKKKKIERLPISPTIKALKVGESAEWPVEQMESVRILTGRIQIVGRREGLKFKREVDGLVVRVTRVS